MAINGDGFFQVKTTEGVVEYTRAGAFKIDKDGYVSTTSGAKVQGFQVNAGSVTGEIGDIQTQTALLAPKPTANVTLTGNLDASKGVPSNGTFSATDPTSYTAVTSMAVFDSKGASHTLDVYFVKTATANQWDVITYVDSTNTTRGVPPPQKSINCRSALRVLMTRRAIKERNVNYCSQLLVRRVWCSSWTSRV